MVSCVADDFSLLMFCLKVGENKGFSGNQMFDLRHHMYILDKESIFRHSMKKTLQFDDCSRLTKPVYPHHELKLLSDFTKLVRLTYLKKFLEFG